MRIQRLLTRELLAGSMLLAAGCAPSATSRLPAGLVVEEHALVHAPDIEPLSFQPVAGSMEAVLRTHAAQRLRVIPHDTLLLDGHLAMRASQGSDVLTATEEYDGQGPSAWVTVRRDGREIYRIDTGMPSPIAGLRGLWTYGDHWMLETVNIQPDSFQGRLSLDGSLLFLGNSGREAFEFQLMRGKPFYFLRKDGRIGFAYDGREVAAGYEEIPHYQCCSAGVLSPLHAENMIAFFARRDRTWYYVEIGFFDQ